MQTRSARCIWLSHETLSCRSSQRGREVGEGRGWGIWGGRGTAEFLTSSVSLAPKPRTKTKKQIPTYFFFKHVYQEEGWQARGPARGGRGSEGASRSLWDRGQPPVQVLGLKPTHSGHCLPPSRGLIPCQSRQRCSRGDRPA